MSQKAITKWFDGSDALVLEGLGQRIASARLKRNITQQSLAREAGVSRSTVRRLEGGESTQLTAFLRVLRALDLLAGLEMLLPDSTISPLQVLDHHGQQRQRASRIKPGSGDDAPSWKWGEDQ